MINSNTTTPTWKPLGSATSPKDRAEFRIFLNRPITRIRPWGLEQEIPPLPAHVLQPTKNEQLKPLPDLPNSIPTVAPAQLFETEIGERLLADKKRIEEVLLSVQNQANAAFGKVRLQVGELQQAAVELALTIATRLLHRDIEEDRFEVETILQEMTEGLEPSRNATIRLNPLDLELLEARMEGSLFQLPNLPDAVVVGDPSLARGTCQVDTGETILVSDFNTQLQQLREQLLGELGHARS